MIPTKRAFSVLLISIFWSLGTLAVCSTDYQCSNLQDLTSWNEEYVTSLCTNDGFTDKSTNAVLCDADKGNAAYEESLKLAILNTMYGTGGSTSCAYFCMYDPHYVVGESSISFKWSNQQCWKVIVGSSDFLCHKSSIAEWTWAVAKSQNWCCPEVPTDSDRPCSADHVCDHFQNLASWNQEYVTSLCTNDGLTDKSMSATLCAAWEGVSDYEDSLKLAIVNTMYGTGAGASKCQHWCMYDPLHIGGDDAVGFKWTNKNRCWNVVLGAKNRLCYILAIDEWSRAASKTENWCCRT